MVTSHFKSGRALGQVCIGGGVSTLEIFKMTGQGQEQPAPALTLGGWTGDLQGSLPALIFPGF